MDVSTESSVEPKQSKIDGVIIATLFIVGLGTLVGLATAYIAAFVVVKAGLNRPHLVIVFPLLVIGALAWRTAQTQSLRDGAIAILTAGALAALLLVVWQPSSPAKLFTKQSSVSDVELRGDDAVVTLQSETKMTELPPIGATAGYVLLLACFAVVATTLGHGAMSLRSRHRRPF